jgi:transposase-like protein
VVEARIDEGGKMQEKETLDEKLPGLFEPDTLLPIQYFEAMRKKHQLEGEKRLILSVLEDAVECFMKCIDSPTGKGQRLFRDADEWINLEDKHWVFSFDNVCEMLDINPDYMRKGLRQWKERKLEAIQRAAAASVPAADTSETEMAADSAPSTKSTSVSRPQTAAVFNPRAAGRKTVPATSGHGSSRNLRKVQA